MNEEIEQLEKQMMELSQKLSEARKNAEPEPVKDYTFKSLDGDVKLSGLFGDRDDLLVIHNMGKSCPYCTLWADGFNGEIDHLQNRAALALASPDEPEVQNEFAESRGWRYRMVCNGDSNFAQDMGFVWGDGLGPGCSAFHRNEDESIVRTGRAWFGPGDQFCAVWHFNDLFGYAETEWQPAYKYDEP